MTTIELPPAEVEATDAQVDETAQHIEAMFNSPDTKLVMAAGEGSDQPYEMPCLYYEPLGFAMPVDKIFQEKYGYSAENAATIQDLLVRNIRMTAGLQPDTPLIGEAAQPGEVYTFRYEFNMSGAQIVHNTHIAIQYASDPAFHADMQRNYRRDTSERPGEEWPHELAAIDIHTFGLKKAGETSMQPVTFAGVLLHGADVFIPKQLACMQQVLGINGAVEQISYYARRNPFYIEALSRYARAGRYAVESSDGESKTGHTDDSGLSPTIDISSPDTKGPRLHLSGSDNAYSKRNRRTQNRRAAGMYMRVR